MRPPDHPIRNSFFTGFAAGLLGPILGALLFYLFALSSTYELVEYFEVAYQGNILPKLLALGGLVNFAIFFLLIRARWYWSSRALIIATMLWVLVVVILKLT